MLSWKLHGNGKTIAPGEVVSTDERLTWPRTIGMGVQHIAAMFERNGLLEEALETWREVELKLTDAFGEVALPTLKATRRRLMVQQELGDNQVAQQLDIVENTILRVCGQ